MTDLADRLEAAIASWKARLKGGQGSREVGSANAAHDPIAELQRAADQLAEDLRGLTEAASLEAQRAASFEAAAMEAIRAGDDQRARAALRNQQECLDTMARLDADATVLRTMIAECEAVLGDAN